MHSLATTTKAPSPLWHLLTGAVGAGILAAAAYFFHIGPTGPEGPAGVNTVVINKMPVAGLCVYFGPDSQGHTRLQVWTPSQDASGIYCTGKAHLVSVVPAK